MISERWQRSSVSILQCARPLLWMAGTAPRSRSARAECSCLDARAYPVRSARTLSMASAHAVRRTSQLTSCDTSQSAVRWPTPCLQRSPCRLTTP